MLKFMNGYLPDVYKAQVDAGLVRMGDGIRFCQNILLDEKMKFNELAKKDGELYNIVKELDCPFYIDRLQGGTYIDEYPYDRALLDEYKRMLGDNFWGFQMHEWLSNYASDIGKLSDLQDDLWTAENIKSHVNKKFNSKILFLESMTANEMAQYRRPTTFARFYANMTDIFKIRQHTGDLIPVDSSMLMYAFEIDAGVKRIMPEVGAQTGDARLQICYARGMTGKEGLEFGVYYEPWGRTPRSKNYDPAIKPPITACCYHREEKNEWGIRNTADFPFKTDGENGGGSRSLQKRIFLYSYLSGASFMSEEWGVCNLFYDWNDFELSPYGRVKKDFIDFMKKYPEVGEKLTPIGVVIPKNIKYLDNVYKKPDYVPPFTCDFKNYETVKQEVGQLFAQSTKMIGTERNTLVNSAIPDALDLFNEGYADEKRYEYLVDLTHDDDFAKSHKNICKIDEINTLLEKLLPCYVKGDLHWLINRSNNGGYYLSVFNHSGVVRTIEDGEFTLAKADATVEITIKTNATPVLCEGKADLKSIDGKYYLTVAAGDWAFIKF